jgi:hypothetical protein
MITNLVTLKTVVIFRSRVFGRTANNKSKLPGLRKKTYPAESTKKIKQQNGEAMSILWVTKVRNHAIVLLAVLIALIFSASCYAGTKAGDVLQLDGPLSARNASAAVRSLYVGSAVEEGDTLVTGKKTYARIRFSDDGEMILRPETEFRVSQYFFDKTSPAKDRASFKLLKGGLRSITGLIGKRHREGYKMVTETAVIGIRGTTYEAKMCGGNCPSSRDGLYLFVLEGVIGVSNKAGSLDVGAGRYAYVADEKSLPALIPATPTIDLTLPLSLGKGPEGIKSTDGIDRHITEIKKTVKALGAYQTHQLHTAVINSIQNEESATRANEQVVSIEGEIQGQQRHLVDAVGTREAIASESRGCFCADTLVKMDDGSLKPFASIRPGDRVTAYDIGYDRAASKRVSDVYSVEANHLYTINGEFVTTGGERLLTRDGWKPVRDLKKGDAVHVDGHMKEIVRIEYVRIKSTLYNMQVHDTHNFYVVTADGSMYLVHNSSGGGGGGK